MNSLARLCVDARCRFVPLAFLAFVHELGDEGLELGHLSLEFLDAAGILGDALAVEGGLLGGVIGHVLAMLLGVETLLEHTAAVALDDASRTPTTVQLSGTSLTTTELPPILTLLPMRMLPSTLAPVPTVTLLPRVG